MDQAVNENLGAKTDLKPLRSTTEKGFAKSEAANEKHFAALYQDLLKCREMLFSGNLGQHLLGQA